MNLLFANEAREALTKFSRWDLWRVRNMGAKLPLGEECREDWTGYLPFYLFWCDDCQRYSKDYPHGHLHRQSLNCNLCGRYEGFVPLKISFEQAVGDLFLLLKLRFSRKREASDER